MHDEQQHAEKGNRVKRRKKRSFDFHSFCLQPSSRR